MGRIIPYMKWKITNYPFIVEHDPLIVDLPIKNGGSFP
jgi:hypothetical protein